MKRQTSIRFVGMFLAPVAMWTVALNAAATTATPSAIGNQVVQWIAVSPAYANSGLVVAMAAPLQGCSQNCIHLWVSHNGGNSWSQSPASGWDGGRPEIAINGSGHEVLVAASGSELQTSSDGGNSWSNIAANGTDLPAISPTFGSDGAVAVANPQGHDYVYRNGASGAASGSGGSYTDLEFMYAPGFPLGGHFAPVLLSAEDSRTQLPVIEQCSASFSCNTPTTLAGSTNFSAPATLFPSTDYGADGTVFAQAGRGIYKSVNGGAAFTPLALVPSNGAEATATPMLALAPGYREAGPVRTAYAAVFQVFTDKSNPHSAGGVYETTDGGTTWHPLGSPSPLDGGVFSVAVAPDGRLFAGYTGEAGGAASAGLLCSQNGGQTWQASCSPVGGGTGSSGGSGSGTSCSGSTCHAATGPAATSLAQPSGVATPASTGAAGGSVLGSSGSGNGSGGTGGKVLLGVSLFVVLLLVGAGAYVLTYLRRRSARSAPPP